MLCKWVVGRSPSLKTLPYAAAALALFAFVSFLVLLGLSAVRSRM